MFETVVPSVLDQWDNVPQEWQLPLLILTSATACLILAFGVFKITSKAPSSSSSSTEPIKEITSTETQVTFNDSDESIDDDQQEVTASENDDADPSSPPKLVSNSFIKLKESACISTPKKSMDNDISSPTTPTTTTTTSSELPLNVPSDEMDDENDTDASSSPSPSTPTKTPIKTPTKRSPRLANKKFGSIATPVGRRSARIARKATQ